MSYMLQNRPTTVPYASGQILSYIQRIVKKQESLSDTVATLSFKTTDGAVSAVEFIIGDYELAAHKHNEAQLMLVVRGFVTCEVASGLWMVPPQCAMWIPAGMEHSMRGVGDFQVYCVYLEPKLTNALPRECCTLTVSPLLRELVIETSHLQNHYDVDGPDGRMIETMLDRLATAPIEQLHLPMPSDRRLRQIADRLKADPSDWTTIPEWARKVGMSERTLSRLLSNETGMSFGRWRQQFQIMLALKQLSEGVSVQAVALALGYESSSAFVTMFRKTLGKPPLKYLASRSQGATGSRLIEHRIRAN
jgi:AraC-like DNA-binding protein/mannose-6-phosphate isomerase-like protein (cupin superfamily)